MKNMDSFTRTYLPTSLNAKIAIGCAALAIFYSVGLAFYRLFLSPLAGFPGPKLAALTGFYEFYYDFFKEGKYVFEIKKMHEQYGSIVRVNPHELSIHDPDFYDKLYVSGSVRRTNNYSHFAKGIDFDGSHFLTTDHDLHRQRRKPLEPFFSRLGIARLEPTIAELVGKLVGRFEALKGTRTVIRLDHAFTAFSGDIIGGLCCEQRNDFLDDPHFSPQWFNLLHTIVRSIPLFMGFPIIIQILNLIPDNIVAWAFSKNQGLTAFQTMARQHIIDAKRDKKNASEKNIDARVSLFRYIVNSDMAESELSVDRLTKEAQVLLGAGTASTARTLDFISYYILADKKVRATLQTELKDVMATYPSKIPSWAELEKLPYLQALIKEGLRLSYGVMHRLPRVSPDVSVQYKEWTIPAGVPVGMSAYMMHTDPRVYKNPHEFVPERWLGEVDPLMKRNLVPFSKGSRNCLGMNLAYAEMNYMLAILYRPGGPAFDLFETDESDVVQTHDFLIPLPKLSTKGIRVMIH